MIAAWKDVKWPNVIGAAGNITNAIACWIILDTSHWTRMEWWAGLLLVSQLFVLWVNLFCTWAGYEQHRRRLEEIETRLEMKAR